MCPRFFTSIYATHLCGIYHKKPLNLSHMDKKQQALRIYMTEGKTQKGRAATVGVCERAIHTWVHEYNWDKLRLAAYQAPVTIADNLCAQLVELQNAIPAREPGKRFPTGEEA